MSFAGVRQPHSDRLSRGRAKVGLDSPSRHVIVPAAVAIAYPPSILCSPLRGTDTGRRAGGKDRQGIYKCTQGELQDRRFFRLRRLRWCRGCRPWSDGRSVSELVEYLCRDVRGGYSRVHVGEIRYHSNVRTEGAHVPDTSDDSSTNTVRPPLVIIIVANWAACKPRE